MLIGPAREKAAEIYPDRRDQQRPPQPSGRKEFEREKKT